MEKICCFTICAKNYIGLSQILEKSFSKYNKNIDFFIIVADEIGSIEEKLPSNVISAKQAFGIKEKLWNEMAFKYNLTEFCTAIKPFSFLYLFQNLKYDKAIYLDPDILVYSDFSEIVSNLNSYSIILTPHFSLLHIDYQGELQENSLLATGVFNLGFIALRNDNIVADFLQWWKNRLVKYCFNDLLDSYFTDQKWIDFLPCFFGGDQLLVYRHLGCNIAPWNFFERVISKASNGKLYVHSRDKVLKDQYPVVFVHYSGYNYREILAGNIVQNNIRKQMQYPDIDILFDQYRDYILNNTEDFNRYMQYDYSYRCFDNGLPIFSFYRRLYRASLEKNIQFDPNPFLVTKNSFYNLIVANKLVIRSDNSIDKMSRYNIEGVSRKLFFVNTLFVLLKSVVGMKRFTILMRMFKPYSRPETYTFMIDKKKMSNNLFENK